MDFISKIKGLRQEQSTVSLYGWLDAQHYDEQAEGTRYLQVSCVDLGIQYEQERLAERFPLLQSQVTWPGPEGSIVVSKTLGQSTFDGVGGDGDNFRRIIASDVALTGDLPMNHDSVDIVVGLLSMPGDGILGQVAGFLGDLGELTMVPQLTAAAGVATKIASGVDKMLGNTTNDPLIGVVTSIQADDLRSGYFVATDWSAHDRAVQTHLRVTDSGLQMNEGEADDPRWVPAQGFSYIVLEVSLTGSKPGRWEFLDPGAALVKDALAKLNAARKPEEIQEAGNAMLLAIDKARNDDNITQSDRVVIARALENRWQQDVERRIRILAAAAEPASNGGLKVPAGVDVGNLWVPPTDDGAGAVDRETARSREGSPISEVAVAEFRSAAQSIAERISAAVHSES